MSSLSALLSEAESLTPADLQALIYEAGFLKRRAREDDYWRDLCDNGTRADIIKAGQDAARSAAVGLAGDYEEVPCARELVAWAVGRHPRRPVLMAGSKAGRIWRHRFTDSGNPNGYAVALFWRYFEAQKVTAFTREQLPVWLRAIEGRITSRYPRVTSSFSDRVNPYWQFHGGGGCFINGKRRWLSRSEFDNLRALYALIQKTENLEARLEAARAHWRGRMSC